MWYINRVVFSNEGRLVKFTATDERLELPLYGLSEAALYLRVPIKTLEYWAFGRKPISPLIRAASKKPRSLSFMNLLECHMLASMRRCTICGFLKFGERSHT